MANGAVKRIGCENDDCDQVLSSLDSQCHRCGRKQMTRRWAIVLLVLYYPIATLLVGVFSVLVASLLFPTTIESSDPVWIAAPLAGVYLLFVVHTVRRYRKRQRQIERADEISGYTS